METEKQRDISSSQKLMMVEGEPKRLKISDQDISGTFHTADTRKRGLNVTAARYPDTEMRARSWCAARAAEHPLVRVSCI